ncbi:hypothetical protein E2562_034676 [Oryza meyeriana var. granulata]|uniref:Uncharacterized protein n=1 Tax=Oryza meyeriana var. granulata TaxID=110450 RepID=A0A6G1C2B6_9ORYZ|nr:hypothetical protein E2562_034676 [Oryza meyeriana var. granulata]
MAALTSAAALSSTSWRRSAAACSPGAAAAGYHGGVDVIARAVKESPVAGLALAELSLLLTMLIDECTGCPRCAGAAAAETAAKR